MAGCETLDLVTRLGAVVGVVVVLPADLREASLAGFETAERRARWSLEMETLLVCITWAMIWFRLPLLGGCDRCVVSFNISIEILGRNSDGKLTLPTTPFFASTTGGSWSSVAS